MTLPQQNKLQGLLTKPVRVLLLSAPAKEEDVLEMTHAAASMDATEEVKRATEVLSEVTNSVYYIYEVVF